MLFDTLNYIAEKINNEKILWGIGASVVLNNYGLIDCPNDIDILVDVKDVEALDNLLKNLGEKKYREKNDEYSTKYFYEYKIQGVDIDMMGGFIINHSGGQYEYTFDSKSVTEVKCVNNIKLPFTSLEDWYIIYQLIPSRENKVDMIENYLVEHGVRNLDLIRRALTKELPDVVRNRVEKLLSQNKVVNKEGLDK